MYTKLKVFACYKHITTTTPSDTVYVLSLRRILNLVLFYSQFSQTVSWYCNWFCWNIFLQAVKIPTRSKPTLKFAFSHLSWECVSDMPYFIIILCITWKWVPKVWWKKWRTILFSFTGCESSAYIYSPTFLLASVCLVAQNLIQHFRCYSNQMIGLWREPLSPRCSQPDLSSFL